MRIIVITPTRNESAHIPITLQCMSKQTRPPLKWIIVDDGSSDNTGEIVKEFMQNAGFIEYVRLSDRGYRKPGAGVVEAFYEGYKKIGQTDYDAIAKFDADQEFPPDFLAKIGEAFRKDPSLGITGPTQYERHGASGQLRKTMVPEGFVGGPHKFYRRQCFEDIGGLIHRAGWDGVDAIRANMKGWTTGEIPDLAINHLRPTGTAKGEGLEKACEKYGDISYYMGGYFWYFMLRVAGRSLEGRNPRIGYHMMKGYFRSKMQKISRESADFRDFLKKKQKENMRYWIRLALKGVNSARELPAFSRELPTTGDRNDTGYHDSEF